MTEDKHITSLTPKNKALLLGLKQQDNRSRDNTGLIFRLYTTGQQLGKQTSADGIQLQQARLIIF
jgi:hypothetical protein